MKTFGSGAQTIPSVTCQEKREGMSLHTTLLTKVLVNFITPWDLLHTSNSAADSLTRAVGIPKALSMQSLFRALKKLGTASIYRERQ